MSKDVCMLCFDLPLGQRLKYWKENGCAEKMNDDNVICGMREIGKMGGKILRENGYLVRPHILKPIVQNKLLKLKEEEDLKKIN